MGKILVETCEIEGLKVITPTVFGDERGYFMETYNQKDYQTAAQTFIQYYNVYPRGTFTELARFHAGKALYLDTPEPRLDQSGTYSAIQQLQMFMEYFPQSSKKEEAQNMIFALQDKLVMKEYLSAKLYYNMVSFPLSILVRFFFSSP